MKTKKFAKKLVLSKQTIVNLGNGEMNHLQGGATPISCFAQTCDQTGDPCLRCPSGWEQVLSVCICEH